eukprot:scaffold177967_cov41-Prasinocladus_malaysianus.AAC.2
MLSAPACIRLLCKARNQRSITRAGARQGTSHLFREDHALAMMRTDPDLPLLVLVAPLVLRASGIAALTIGRPWLANAQQCFPFISESKQIWAGRVHWLATYASTNPVAPR